MARNDPIFTALNRGEVSTQLLGRTDLEHLRLAAQIQANWQPRVLGPMTLRPGSQYLGSINNGVDPCTIFPFVAEFDDIGIIELTANQLRAWIVDYPSGAVSLVTRAPVTTTVPAFGSPGWSVTSSLGTTQTSITAAGLTISNVNIGGYATVGCPLTIPADSIGIEHAVRIVVADGPINFQIGTAKGQSDLFSQQTLDTGVYSLSFTPTTGTAYLEFDSTISPENYQTLTESQPQGLQKVTVTSIALEGPGPMTVPTPWGASVLTNQAGQSGTIVRITPSADVVFVACKGIPQQQINRYSPTSWSVVLYKPVKGPMNAVLGSSSIILGVGAQSGNTTMGSNRPFFTPDMVGTLFRLFHNGQQITQSLSINGTYTDAIRVTGVSTLSELSGGQIVDIPANDRNFTYGISGTWTGEVALERSFDGPTSGFNNVNTYSSNQSIAYTDWLNNEIVWYRLGGGVTSGAAVCDFVYNGGGWAGVCRITGYVDPQTVNIEVLVPFSNYGSAFDWHMSEWSGTQGFPTSTAIHEGRLWWAGAERWWGSASDDYTNFDFDAIGDAAYIDINVGQGPIADINWLLSTDTLLGGGDTQTIAARSNAVQDPLTPTNFNLRFSSTQGSAPIQASKIDNTGIFVNQSTRRIFSAIYNIYLYNIKVTELSNLNPDIGAPGSLANQPSGGYIGMAIQRNPDTIIHLVRSDGQIVCLLFDVDDDVKAFWRKTTAGTYDNVVVLPAAVEDMVFVTVVRNGVRYLERFARLDECTGDLICKLVDSFGTYQGPPTYSFSAPWLANQTVAVWIDGTDAALTPDEIGNPIGPIVLDRNGVGTLPTAAQNITFGLPYKAQFLSTKLAYGATIGTAINEVKRVDHIGFVLQNTHCQGVRYGNWILNPQYGKGSFNSDFSQDFDTSPSALWDNLTPIDDMPMVEKGVTVPKDWIWAFYDMKPIEFAADSDTDNRIYIEAASPRPATVVAVTFNMESNG